MEITAIRLPAANAYLVRGDAGAILVDAGTEAAVPRLRRALSRLGADPRTLRAVPLTHGHADHAGGARLLAGPDVPVLVGAADAPILQAGRNPALTPANLTARIIRPFVDKPFTPYEPDVLVEDVLDLRPYGIRALAVPAGGHTAGSVAVVGMAPGMPALIGDLVRGGYLGGLLAPGRPFTHYYTENAGRDLSALRSLIAAHQPDRLYPGHGGPVRAAAAASLASAVPAHVGA
jgi:hydroxyacylglutathione hydrolase